MEEIKLIKEYEINDVTALLPVKIEQNIKNDVTEDNWPVKIKIEIGTNKEIKQEQPFPGSRWSTCQQQGERKDGTTGANRKKHRGLFSCNLCPKTFKKKSDRNLHRTRHTTTYKCQLCPKQYKTFNTLNNHITFVHNRKGLACPTCGKIFTLEGNLINHMKIHEEDRDKHFCDLCKKEFKCSNYLKTHITYVHLKEDLVPCPKCGEKFRKHHLTRHMMTHEKNKVYFTCDLCKRQYTSHGTLKNHKNIKHYKVTKHSCIICEKFYSTKGHLKRHMETAHTTQEKDTYTCYHCKKNYARKREMECHIRTKHYNEHYCIQCKKYFKSFKKFNLHKIVHKGEGYKCQHCTNVYLVKQSLKSHMEFHFPIPMQCTICKKTVMGNDSLRHHIKHYHETSGEDYKCEVCKKHFDRRYLIAKHMESHFKRYIKCPICRRVFGHKSNLKSHIKVVHKKMGKLYHCNDCTGAFTRGNMSSHWLERHNPKFKYKCGLCNYGYPTAQALAAHTMCRGKTCTICQRKHSTLEALNKHQKTHKVENQDKISRRLRRCLPHPFTDRSDNSELTCEYCCKKYSSVNEMTVHKKQHRVFNSFVDLRGETVKFKKR